MIWSTSRKTIISIELTCPMEENLEARMHEKIARYTGLKSRLEDLDWKVVLHTIEVGARGLVHAKTARKCFRGLARGFTPRATPKIIKNLSLLSVRASLTIYMHRNTPLWPDTPLLRTPDCVLTDFEKLRFKLSSLSAKELDCWRKPSFVKRRAFKPKLESVPEHNTYDRSARVEAPRCMASIAPGLQAEQCASAE